MKELNRITRFSEYYNTIDLTLCTSGYQYSSHKTDGPYAPNFNILQYIIKGKGSLMLKNKKYEVAEGDLFFLPQGIQCSYVGNPMDPYSYYWISFKGNYSAYLLNYSKLSADTPVLHMKSHQLQTLFHRIFIDMKKNKLSANIRCLSALYQIFSILIEVAKTDQIRPMNFIIEQSIAFMSKNLNQNITIISICKKLNVDRCYFSKLFKKQMGIGPKQYLIELRISNGRELLKDTSLSIEEISCLCGMTHTAFSRMFRNIFGNTPSVYRKINYTKETTREEILLG